MFKFNNKNKTKIVLGLLILIVIVVCYHFYINQSNFSINESDILISAEENSNESNNKIEELLQGNNKNIIVVHISGAVQSEGIVELEEESRIINAIEKAGGLKENACIKDINLASKLEDGEKIYIPTQEEYNNMQSNNQVESNLKETVTTKNNETKNTKVNINSATQSELETLPGIGAATALKIITYRNENGKFKTVEDIKKVKGIGESKFKEIKDLIVI